MKKTILTTSILALFAGLLFADGKTYTESSYNSYMNTSKDTFTGARISFYGGWTSNYDTVNATGDMSFYRTGEYNVANANITLGGRIHVEETSAATISNSTLNISDVYVTKGANFKIQNSTTTFTSRNDASIKNASSFLIEGGTVTTTNENPTGFYLEQGSTFIVKDAQVDFRGFELKTNTNSSYSNVAASITIDNSVFNTGFINIYGYKQAGALPELNIINGSNATMSLYKIESGWTLDPNYGLVQKTQVYNIRGGKITVSGNSVLNITSDMVEQGKKDYGIEESDQSDNPFAGLGGGVGSDVDLSGANQQDYTTSISIADDSKIIVAGDTNVTNLEVKGLLQSNSLEVVNLIVSNSASISLAEGEIANFDNLTLILEDIDELGETINLSNVLSDNLSVVLAALEENDVFTIQSGSETFSALVGENGIATITPIPEPSTYAMIIGALALAFAAYRRRK